MKVFKMNLFLVVALSLSFTSVCYGKDFATSLRGLQTTIQSIFQVLGVIAFMLAGGMFYFSKQRGFDQLTSVIVGTVVFGSASTVFSVLIRIFN